MRGRSATGDATRSLLGAIAWLGIAAYLAQHLRLPENPVDGGLILRNIRAVAEGGLPFLDFLDSYGPAHWTLPALAYELAGERAMGVRILLWLQKLLVVALAFGFVRALSDRFHAWLTVAWVTLLLGLPWPYMQEAYPFVPLAAVQLTAWWLLLLEPLRPRLANIILAGALAGLAVNTKLNTGAFMLTGTLFHCLYFMSGPATPPTGPMLRAARWLGLPCYLAPFLLFLWPNLDVLWTMYLVIPFVLMLAWCIPAIGRGDAFGTTLGGFVALATAALAAMYVSLAITIGPAAVGAFVDATREVFTRADYATEWPAFGVQGQLIGFNEHYWPLLPWAVSLACALLLVLRRATRAGTSLDDLRLGSLWALYASQLFVLYSRPDNAHMVQAMTLGLPVLFILLHRLGSYVPTSPRMAFRTALAVLVAAGYLSLGSRTSWETLTGPNDWHNPRLAGVLNRPPDAPWLNPEEMAFYERTHVALGETARLVDELTEDGAPMLLLNRSELLHFASNTQPATGRYRYLLYLVANDYFARADVEALSPPEMVPEILRNPPPVVVSSYGHTTIAREFPEFTAMLKERYELRASFEHLLVYTRRPG